MRMDQWVGALNRVTIACFRAKIVGIKYLKIQIIHLTQPRVFSGRTERYVRWKLV